MSIIIHFSSVYNFVFKKYKILGIFARYYRVNNRVDIYTQTHFIIDSRRVRVESS